MSTDPITDIAERWAAIAAAAQRLRERIDSDRTAAEAALQTETTRHAREVAAIETERDNTRRNLQERLERQTSEATGRKTEELARLDAKVKAAIEEIERRAEEASRDAREGLQHALWLADSVHESGERRPKAVLEEIKQTVAERIAALEGIVADAARQTRRYRQSVPASTESPAATGRMDPMMVLATQVALGADVAERIRRLRLPGLYRGPILLVPAIFTALGGAALAWTLGMRGGLLGAGAGVGVLITAAIAVAGWFRARSDVVRAWQPLHRAVATARQAAQSAVTHAQQECEESEKAALQRLKRERQAAQQRFGPIVQAADRQRQERLEELRRVSDSRRTQLEAEAGKALAEAKTLHETGLARCRETHARKSEVEASVHAEREAARRDAEALARQEREAAWIQSRDAFGAWADQRASAAVGEREVWTRAYQAALGFPEALQAGLVRLDLKGLPDALPTDSSLAWTGATEWQVPLGRAMPRQVSTLIEAPGDARPVALAGLQAMVARLLVQCPPGKVRLTLMDPVGLGQSFAGFMHLADEMEQLVGERIWTEARQIEQKLTDLTEHMETVIQKYLRDEFATIADYNAQAGQLAEPIRIVVMADFPAGLNEVSTRRLASILQSGPRCGVHLLLLADPSRPYPDGLSADDVRRTCRRIFWRDGAFHIDEPGLETAEVSLDSPPPPSRLQELLRSIGQSARSASVVQVPFSAIEPPDDRIWSGSTASSLRVPIGRTGATQLQNLVLGEGTRQHVLLAGKTGSGKSTLLNAMIVNLSTWFSPDELELWLIDFKKGVEFKAYAQHGLPHARAVAVESDREFGLSVLQGLDAELKRRGDLFRSVGVQDLAAWRRQGRSEPMPRALLIVDEFQELFVEEDKVSQEAALLLDRLVRQGRAFGMHVILGSQTLGGAYALPRTTMGQMGVRIALQCNEADAALILSDDNTAARLLSRPGEAIYNDAGGLIEGNSPFQVVWLNDVEREDRVKRLAERGRATSAKRPAMIVFDGTSKADLAACRPLVTRLRSGEASLVLPLHLGEPVAIREATVASLRRQSGSNVVVVGQSETMALGISIAMLASARAAGGAGTNVTLLDGSPADSPEAGRLQQAAQSLGLAVSAPGYREVDDAIRALGELVARRIESGRSDEAPVLLLVHGLQRFRSLRRDEDDFSFSSGDGPPKPDRILAAVLRDGPAVGVHVAIWADTATSLQRSIDRGSMREFDMRVLMQMGANDSSTLIDSPLASRLGPERALLFSEERGTIERFRPFEPATPGELESMLRSAKS
jgi:ABC-type multidrug transport system fused ATPase/permease subunit